MKGFLPPRGTSVHGVPWGLFFTGCFPPARDLLSRRFVSSFRVLQACLTVFTATLAAVCVPRRASASVPGVVLHWSAPAGCPSGDDVTARILALALPYGALDAEDTVSESGPRFDARVLVKSGGATVGERILHAGSCEELAESAAVVLAMSVAAAAEPSPPPPPSPSAVPGVPEEAAVNPAAAAPAANAPPGAVRDALLRVSALAAIDVGTLPNAVAGGGLSLSMAPGHGFVLGVAATLFGATSAYAGKASLPGGELLARPLRGHRLLRAGAPADRALALRARRARARVGHRQEHGLGSYGDGELDRGRRWRPVAMGALPDLRDPCGGRCRNLYSDAAVSRHRPGDHLHDEPRGLPRVRRARGAFLITGFPSSGQSPRDEVEIASTRTESTPTESGSRTAAPQGVRLDFDAVYEEHFAFVWRAARRMGVPESAADDAVQNVFLVLHRKLGEYDGTTPLRRWLLGIVARVVSSMRRTYYRKDSRCVPHETDKDGALSLPSRSGSPLDLAEQAEALQLVVSLLDELEQEKREVLVLSQFEELSVPEIADCLDLNVNTVYSRLRAAKSAFDAAFARHEARTGSRTP